MIKKKSLSLLVLLLALLLPFKALAYSGAGDEELLFGILAIVIAWLVSGIVILIRLLFKRSQTLFILGYAFAASIAILSVIALTFLGGLDSISGDEEFGETQLTILVIPAVYALLVYVFGNYVNRESKEAREEKVEQAHKQSNLSIIVITLVMVAYELYTLSELVGVVFGSFGEGGFQNLLFTLIIVLYQAAAVTAIVLFAKKHIWGWHLLVFYLLLVILSQLVSFIMNTINGVSALQLPPSFYLQAALILLVCTIILYVLQRENLREIYGISSQLQKKSLLLSIGSAVAFIVLTRLAYFI